jgi:hypothetical protein
MGGYWCALEPSLVRAERAIGRCALATRFR